jgi:tight adherence protein C
MEALVDPRNLLTALIAVLTFATLFTLFGAMTGGAKLEGRMKAVAERKEELKRRSRQQIAQQAQQGSALRQTDAGFKKRVVDRLNLAKMLEDTKVADNLAQAGYRGPRPITTFYFFRFTMPFVMAIFVAIYLFFINDFGLPGMSRIAAVVGGFVLGFYLPNLYISNRAAKRRQSIVQAFPDSLDLLLICVESGMSIEAAIQKVGAEIGGQSIDLAEEFTLLSAELSYLPERRMAYDGFAKRTNHPGVKSVATAMIQSEKYGTQLGQALRVMAKENRELRLSAAEKKAAALPAKLTVPMIVFFLPVLFVVILGPAIIKIQDMNAG